MIKCFKYKNAKGETATRICNVVHVSDTEIRGFDYNKLSQAEQDMVNRVYDDDADDAERWFPASYCSGSGSDSCSKACNYQVYSSKGQVEMNLVDDTK